MEPAREIIDLEDESDEDANRLSDLDVGAFLNDPVPPDQRDPPNMNINQNQAPHAPYGPPLPQQLDPWDRQLPRLAEQFPAHMDPDMYWALLNQPLDLPPQPNPAPIQPAVSSPLDQSAPPVSPEYEVCLQEILEIFSDISHDHIKQLYDAELLTSKQTQTSLVRHLVEKILDEGGKYPKEKDRLNELKRKRDLGSDEEILKQDPQNMNGHLHMPGTSFYSTTA